MAHASVTRAPVRKLDAARTRGGDYTASMNRISSEDAPPYRAHRLGLDDTSNRLRAYVASVRPLSGVADVDDDACYQRGRSLIERLALSAADADRLSLRISFAVGVQVLTLDLRKSREAPSRCNGPPQATVSTLHLDSIGT